MTTCEKHQLIYQFRCTACDLEETHDKQLAEKDAVITYLQGTIDQLNQRIEDYRRELGL